MRRRHPCRRAGSCGPGGRPARSRVGAGYHQRARVGARHVEPVGAALGVLPPLGQPLVERLADPRVAAVEVGPAGGGIDEAGVDDDAVGIVDVQVTLVADGQVGFDPQSPAEVGRLARSEEHTSELQSLMRISYAVFCLKKKKNTKTHYWNIEYNINHTNTEQEQYII